ncbi:MAG: hypothetical protein DRJ03_00960 [Chloroflexi bacterium]|nr:MAG: hypothetical protein DRJ03_00960 [Chloroflexota bacterium]
MYKLTIYEGDNKSVEDIQDEDELRERIDNCLDDLEARNIKTVIISWVSQRFPPEKPFWEK